MKINKVLFSLLIILISALSGCDVTLISWNQKLPEGAINAEIMYLSHEKQTYKPILNFIQADGTLLQSITMQADMANPIWSPDQALILFLMSKDPGIGYPAYWNFKTGEIKDCFGNDLPQFFQIESPGNPNNRYEVFISDVEEISLFDLASCKRIKTFIDITGHLGDFEISGFSYLSTSHELLYSWITDPYGPSRKYNIVKMDVKTGNKSVIGEGLNPVWSPDGMQIAYIGLDGLYVMQSNGEYANRLVYRELFDASFAGSPEMFAPKIKWSPDGEWLIYCDSTKEGPFSEKAAVYKLHLPDGNEQLLLTGGYDPTWLPKGKAQ